LTYVPLTLGVAHQLGSIVVFTCSLYLGHALRYARPSLMRTAQAAAIKAPPPNAANPAASVAMKAAAK